VPVGNGCFPHVRRVAAVDNNEAGFCDPEGGRSWTYQRCSHVNSRCGVGYFIQFGKLPCFVVSLVDRMACTLCSRSPPRCRHVTCLGDVEGKLAGQIGSIPRPKMYQKQLTSVTSEGFSAQTFLIAGGILGPCRRLVDPIQVAVRWLPRRRPCSDFAHAGQRSAGLVLLRDRV